MRAKKSKMIDEINRYYIGQIDKKISRLCLIKVSIY